MSEKDPAVKVSNLSKVFKVHIGHQKVLAVSDLSFEVGVGEVYGLIGPNGSGKSTTMKIILGLIQATVGHTEVFGIDSGKVGSRRDVGFLPENPYFYKHLTGAETLKFYGKLCGLRGAKLKERVPELLSLVDLEDAADRRVGGYSKGMLQRIGLAQALVHEPRLVVLDEPTAGVDPRGSRKIRDLVMELKKLGKSVILCSHLLEQVQEVCDRVGIMHKGKMVREGTLAELITVENQHELIIEGMDEAMREKVQQLLDGGGAKIVRSGQPRTNLEDLFLEITDESPKS